MEAPTTMVVAREGLPLWRRLASRLAVTFLALTTLGILLTGYLEYRELKQDFQRVIGGFLLNIARAGALLLDNRKSTRLNSSHVSISYAVFCLKKKKPSREQGTGRDKQ